MPRTLRLDWETSEAQPHHEQTNPNRVFLPTTNIYFQQPNHALTDFPNPQPIDTLDILKT
jgi:hypothetical protein